jgi:di/tripeptidase
MMEGTRMNTLSGISFALTGEELTVSGELLVAEQSRLLVEIRHTDHRTFRDELRRRLAIVEHLVAQCGSRV